MDTFYFALRKHIDQELFQLRLEFVAKFVDDLKDQVLILDWANLHEQSQLIYREPSLVFGEIIVPERSHVQEFFVGVCFIIEQKRNDIVEFR